MLESRVLKLWVGVGCGVKAQGVASGVPLAPPLGEKAVSYERGTPVGLSGQRVWVYPLHCGTASNLLRGGSGPGVELRAWL